MWLWYQNLHLEQYAPEAGAMLTAILLAVYGDNLNRKLKKTIKKYSLFVRFACFVGFWMFLLPAGALFTARVAAQWLSSLSAAWFLPVVLVLVLGLCFLAHREDQI